MSIEALFLSVTISLAVFLGVSGVLRLILSAPEQERKSRGMVYAAMLIIGMWILIRLGEIAALLRSMQQ